jgi:hypothetical protein
MSLKLSIEDDNSAFEGDQRGCEFARILRNLADRLERSSLLAVGIDWPLRDINGNTVGRAIVSEIERHSEDDIDPPDDAGY